MADDSIRANAIETLRAFKEKGVSLDRIPPLFMARLTTADDPGITQELIDVASKKLKDEKEQRAKDVELIRAAKLIAECGYYDPGENVEELLNRDDASKQSILETAQSLRDPD